MIRTSDKIKTLVRLFTDNRQPKVFSFHDCLPDVFTRYIELLVAKRYRIVGGEELWGRASFAPKKKEVVLTFDDGRRNCWTVIFPLLKKYKAKAVVFVIPERVRDTQEALPNLEDYWNGKVTWENLYQSHRREPYLTWAELAKMKASGLVEVCSHGLRHEVVACSARLHDFQHPGVYEMPVYFDEWFQAGRPAVESVWGVPVYERSWAPLAQNVYEPPAEAAASMNAFVKKQGGFLFFRKKRWRALLQQHYDGLRPGAAPGLYRKNPTQETLVDSVSTSKRLIESRLKSSCPGFSLPLYQDPRVLEDALERAGYRLAFGGPFADRSRYKKVPILNRLPGFWLKFLSYF
ncbi:MAG: polysaccharide deacetylase family protein [Deltaproteobacteria bacterium]